MSVRTAALTAALLTVASVSSAQMCVPLENRQAKKQQELLQVQSKINRLYGSIAAFEEGIALQEGIADVGQLHAAMGGTAGVARVTKAMSDTFLDLTQSVSPLVKKTYDAFDLLVATGAAVYEGNAIKATAKGLDTVQKGIEYRGSPSPEGPMTPKKLSAAVKITDDLRRGDLVGSSSKMAAEFEKMLDKTSTKSRSVVRAGSKAAAGFADTPGKTMDSRVADELGALGDLSKLAANVAHTRGAGTVAGLAGRSGRLLGYSGSMMEQVSRAKQGLGEAVDMYGEYKRIEARSAGTQAHFQRQIAQKSQEIGRLQEQAERLRVEIYRVEAERVTCQQAADAARLAKANTSKMTRGVSRNNASSGRMTYTRRSWDRQASRQRRERIIDLRNWADERRRRNSPTDSYSSPGPNYQVQYPSAPTTPSNPPQSRPDPSFECMGTPAPVTENTGSECIPYPKETVKTR